MNAESDPLLTVEGVSHAFGDIVAVDSVSFEVQPASLVAIVGPNGSGKTTILRAMVGLLDHDEGSVERPTTAVGRPIGYLPQQPRFRPGFTARETLVFYTRLAGVETSVADELLARVGLEGAGSIRVDHLSGGMLGLLGIAQALIGDPPIVILDEPTTGLDPGMRRHIFGVVTQLADEGHGVVIASHDLELVERHADAVLVLDRGRLVAEGSPEALKGRYDVGSLEAVFDSATETEAGAVDVARRIS